MARRPSPAEQLDAWYQRRQQFAERTELELRRERRLMALALDGWSREAIVATMRHGPLHGVIDAYLDAQHPWGATGGAGRRAARRRRPATPRRATAWYARGALPEDAQATTPRRAHLAGPAATAAHPDGAD